MASEEACDDLVALFVVFPSLKLVSPFLVQAHILMSQIQFSKSFGDDVLLSEVSAPVKPRQIRDDCWGDSTVAVVIRMDAEQDPLLSSGFPSQNQHEQKEQQ